MLTPTSFVEKTQALHQKLQQLIDTASPNTDKTQVNWGLLKKVASYLRATPQRLDSMCQLNVSTTTSSLTHNCYIPMTDPTLKNILDAVHQIEQYLIASLCQEIYIVAVWRDANTTPDSHRQQTSQDPPQ